MKKRICALLLALCLLLTACGSDSVAAPSPSPSETVPETTTPETAAPELPTPEAEPAPELTQREQDWIEDFDYLKEQVLKYHPDPFYFCSEEEFNWKFDQLAAKISQLSDTDIYFELAAIIAGMGDTHTRVLRADSIYGDLFPITVSYFGDKLYLSSYLEDYEQLQPYLLHEIVAVNGVDIAYLKQKAACVGNPFNSWRSKGFLETFFIPAFFDWAGCDYRDGYTFQILNENREVESVEVPVISSEDYEAACRGGAMIWPESLYSIPYLKEGNWAGYFQEENGDYIYLSFADISSPSRTLTRELFEQAAELIEAHPDCGKLVIDLRSNPGGYPDYVYEAAQMLKAPTIEHTYVVTGNWTQSAAIECISIFREELGAVTVGEPTGQFTSFFAYQYVAKCTLPHSRIQAFISTDWHEGPPIAEVQYDENGKLYEWECTVLPDVFVDQDIEDIRQGKDSVIQWVLAQ